MKTLAEFKKENFIFQDNNNPETTYKIISRDEVIEKPLSETYDQYGQMIGEANAGDYSVMNTESNFAIKDCIEEIKNHFNVNLNDDQVYDLKEIIIDEDYDNINYYDEIKDLFDKKELQSFVEKWREENEAHTMCTCFEYWDGSNWKSIVFDYDGQDYHEYSEVSDEIYESIFNEMYKDGEEILEYIKDSPGMKKVTTESYIFKDSNWQGAYGIEITENYEIR